MLPFSQITLAFTTIFSFLTLTKSVPPIAIQTPAQMKDSIDKTHKLIQNILDQDITSAGNTVNAAITTYLSINSPVLTDLVTLREALYVYKNLQSNQGLDYFIDILLSVVKSFIYDYQIGFTSSVQIGTLGSAYACNSLSDDNPTWIATGSSNIADSIIASKQCNKWSQKAFTTIPNGNMVDSSVANVYMSKSSSGGCFEVIGSLWTASTTASIAVYASFLFAQLNIPSLKITCASGSCSTESTFLTSTKGNILLNFLVPSMPITCTGSSMSSCSTAPITVSNLHTLTIPSQSLDCSTSCSFSSLSLTDNSGVTGISYPSQAIAHAGSTYLITPAAYTSFSTNYVYYVPTRYITYDGTSVYNTDPITVTHTYLTIPSYTAICDSLGYSCRDTSVKTINDSAGNSVTIPSVAVSCVSGACYTASQTISISNTAWPVGSVLQYLIQTQYLECDGSSCIVPKLIVYSGTSSSTYFATIPSLPVYPVGDSAASLRGLCEDMLDS